MDNLAVHNVARPWPEAERQQLAAWEARQKQLTVHRAEERTRMQQATEPAIRRGIERVIDFLGKEMKRLDQEVSEWIARSETWKPQDVLLRSAPGVGPKTAQTLLAQWPELGRVTRREIASLVGLAPFACDSGQRRGKRRIRGGRSSVRGALYLASRTAKRVPGPLGDFFERLVASGKPRQLVLIAVARKPLLALNEMMRTSTPWKPHSCPVSA